MQRQELKAGQFCEAGEGEETGFERVEELERRGEMKREGKPRKFFQEFCCAETEREIERALEVDVECGSVLSKGESLCLRVNCEHPAISPPRTGPCQSSDYWSKAFDTGHSPGNTAGGFQSTAFSVYPFTL